VIVALVEVHCGGFFLTFLALCLMARLIVTAMPGFVDSRLSILLR